MGYNSGYSNTTGGNNQFLGYQSGYTNTTGATNQFSGYQSGYSNTIGNTNQFSGFESGYSNTTASYGQFMGYQSGYSTTTGGNNQFLGYNSGHSNTVGGNNLFIGNQSGFSNTTGNNNFGIGYMAGPMTGALSNAGAIGYNAQVGTSNTLVLGGTGSDAVNVLIGYTNDSGSNYKLDVNGTIRATATLVVSDARLKQNVRPVTGGLASVLRLRGVRYDFRRAEFPAKNLPIGQQIGFIAQEMEKVYPELVTTDAQGFKGVNYAQLTPVLVQAMQEQQAEIMALKAANADLKATTAGLKASLDSKASASTLDEMRVALQALRGEIQILKASTSTASAK